jgi:hypothetical protein
MSVLFSDQAESVSGGKASSRVAKSIFFILTVWESWCPEEKWLAYELMSSQGFNPTHLRSLSSHLIQWDTHCRACLKKKKKAWERKGGLVPPLIMPLSPTYLLTDVRMENGPLGWCCGRLSKRVPECLDFGHHASCQALWCSPVQ